MTRLCVEILPRLPNMAQFILAKDYLDDVQCRRVGWNAIFSEVKYVWYE